MNRRSSFFSMIQFVAKQFENLQINFELIDAERGCGRKLEKSSTLFSGDKIFLQTWQPETKFYMTTISMIERKGDEQASRIQYVIKSKQRNPFILLDNEENEEKCTDVFGHYCLCDRNFVRESISKMHKEANVLYAVCQFVFSLLFIYNIYLYLDA